MRTWNRGVSPLGNRTREEQLQGELMRRWPPEDFAVNIEVTGAQDTTAIGVHVWNGASIDVRGTVYPEDFVGVSGTPSVTAAIAKVAEIIEELRNRGEL